jgi:outer membrane receptor for ferrienterochelin and colicin
VNDQNNNIITNTNTIQTSTPEPQKLNTPIMNQTNQGQAQIQIIGSTMTMPVMLNTYTNHTFPSWNSICLEDPQKHF